MNTQEEYQELTRKFEREHGRNSNETLKVNIPSMRWFISQSFALCQRDGAEKVVKAVEEVYGKEVCQIYLCDYEDRSARHQDTRCHCQPQQEPTGTLTTGGEIKTHAENPVSPFKSKDDIDPYLNTFGAILKPAQQEPMNQDNQVVWEKKIEEITSEHNGCENYHDFSYCSPEDVKELLSRVAKDSYAEGIRRASENVKEVMDMYVSESAGVPMLEAFTKQQHVVYTSALDRAAKGEGNEIEYTEEVKK